jgi:hypothetical protein
MATMASSPASPCTVVGTPLGAVAAVVDGLGRDDIAAQALRSIEANANESPFEIVRRSHAALQGTGGVALSLAAFDAEHSMLGWLGVGDLEAALCRADGRREWVAPRGGVVGWQLPTLDEARFQLAPGDTLILGSGIRLGLPTAPPADPQVAAQTILSRHARGVGDAIVLVIRWR